MRDVVFPSSKTQLSLQLEHFVLNEMYVCYFSSPAGAFYMRSFLFLLLEQVRDHSAGEALLSLSLSLSPQLISMHPLITSTYSLFASHRL